MVADACVNCHDTIAGSPKVDWKLGDVRGVLEVSSDIGATNTAGNKLSMTIIFAIIVSSTVLITLVVIGAHRVTQPLIRMSDTMDDLADGVSSVEVPSENWVDEIKRMANSVQIFKTNAIEAAKMRDKNSNANGNPWTKGDRREIAWPMILKVP